MSDPLTVSQMTPNQRGDVARLKEECGFRRLYGKYRGVVENNFDPRGLGRILVTVPEISPVPLLNWATPCTPVGGPQHGMFAVPPVKAEVWIEFEQGDADYPVWVGCMWGGNVEVPSKAPTANPLFQSITFQTPSQHSIVISDAPGAIGGVQITTRLQQKILLTDLGIELDNGQGASIRMIGPMIQIEAAQVNINNGALTVVGGGGAGGRGRRAFDFGDTAAIFRRPDMPGLVVHVGATVVCPHAGQATPAAPDPRVSVSGQQVVTQPTVYSIGGCTLPPSAGGPCVTAQWTTAATRVFAGGIPVLLFDSQSVCTPTGVPLQVVATQMRVSAQ